MNARVPVVAGVALASLAGSVALAAAPSAYVRPGRTQLASSTASGKSATYPAANRETATTDGKSDLSGDGRYVVFESEADNLVPNLTVQAGVSQIYRKDLRTGKIELVSTDNGGTPGVLGSYYPAVTADGRYVSFASKATNLVAGDTNATADIFRRDMKTGQVIRVSVTTSGQQATPPPLGQYASTTSTISDDGQRIVFTSTATNLVANTKGSGACCSDRDVYLRDLRSRRTELVSVGYDGRRASGFGGSISGNGRYVAFTAGTGIISGLESDLDVFVRDLSTQKTILASVATDGSRASIAGQPCIGQTPDALTPVLTPIVGGAQHVGTGCAHSNNETVGGASHAISDDGRFVTFYSDADNLVPNVSQCKEGASYAATLGEWCLGTYVRDLVAKRTERIDVTSYGEPQARRNSNQGEPISGNGRFVAYFHDDGSSDGCGVATDEIAPGAARQLGLVGVCHVYNQYLYDRYSGEMIQLTRPYNGGKVEPGNCGDNDLLTDTRSQLGSLSADGRYFSFQSQVKNLVAGDTNNHCDVFVRDLGAPLTVGGLGGGSGATSPGPSGTCLVAGVCVPPVIGVAIQPGADLLGARIVTRPSMRDLSVRVDVSHMPSIAGVPIGGLLYGLRFTAKGKRYELRAQRIAATDFDTVGGASFGLFRCDSPAGSCLTKVATLKGGYGTVGDAVVTAVPLSALGLKDGGGLSNVTAFTAVGSYLTGATRVLDSMRLSP